MEILFSQEEVCLVISLCLYCLLNLFELWSYIVVFYIQAPNLWIIVLGCVN